VPNGINLTKKLDRSPQSSISDREEYKHTLAGQGDVVGPGEDLRLVAERAKAFGRELRADGVLGQ